VRVFKAARVLEAIPPWRPISVQAAGRSRAQGSMQDEGRPIWATAEGRAMLAIYAAQVLFLAGLGVAFHFLAFD
jgi:hypothetical protein